MPDKNNDVGIGLQIFADGTPLRTKVWKLSALGLFCLIGLLQAFFWLFANSVEPVILGMPIGMFFIVCLIVLAFVGGLLLLWLDDREKTR